MWAQIALMATFTAGMIIFIFNFASAMWQDHKQERRHVRNEARRAQRERHTCPHCMKPMGLQTRMN